MKERLSRSLRSHNRITSETVCAAPVAKPAAEKNYPRLQSLLK
jgi:hypothetical protein